MLNQSSSIFMLFLASCCFLPRLGQISAFHYQSPYEVHPADIPSFPISSDLSEKEGLDRLLVKSRYDYRSMPPTNGTLTVSVSVLLLTLASPDESSLKYEIEFLMDMSWEDFRLRYTIVNETGPLPTEAPGAPYNYDAMPMRLNHRKRPFLDGLHHHEHVWIPDVYYVKHGDFRYNLDPKHLSLRIYPNGTIQYTTRKHLILSCEGSLPNFPFDVIICTFSVESVSYEEDRLKFVWHGQKGYLRKSESLKELNAYLQQNYTENCTSAHERGNYSCLNVSLLFSRDRAFYFTTVFIPDIILVTSSFITFWLEWNAVPARIMLGVTTMLNFFTTSNSFRATLPVVSELHAMNIWDAFSMIFIYSSLLEFVVVNCIGRKRPRRRPYDENKMQSIQPSPIGPSPVPQQDSNHPIEIVACTSCGPSPCTHTVNNTCKKERPFRERVEENPIKVAKTIDVVSRVAFPVAYAAFLVFFFWNFGAFS